MTHNKPRTNIFSTFIPALFILAFFISGCAEFDQLLKPRVEGLQKAPGFDNDALVKGGLGEIHVQSNLASKVASGVSTSSEKMWTAM